LMFDTHDMFSKSNFNNNLENAIREVLKYSLETKRRNFTETVELQIDLSNYDPCCEKRFSGFIILPYQTKPKLNVMVIGDQYHVEECAAHKLQAIDLDSLKKFNKDKKLIKKWMNNFDVIIASDSLIRQIPRVMGPVLHKVHKFPHPIDHNTPIPVKIDQLKRSVKFQMKKTSSIGVAIGTVSLSPHQLQQNITLAVNFLVSLLRRGWQNVGSLHIKSSMGPAQRIY